MAGNGDKMSLLYWENPVVTGSIFLPPFLIMSGLMYCTLISVLAYTGLTLIGAVVAVKVFGIVMAKANKPNPLASHLQHISQVDLTISPETVEQRVTMIVAKTNQFTAHLKNVIIVQDVMETLKFGLVCYLLTFIGGMMNTLTLLVLVWVLVFTLPKVYLNNQDMADEVISKAMVQINAIKEKVFPAAAPVKKD